MDYFLIGSFIILIASIVFLIYILYSNHVSQKTFDDRYLLIDLIYNTHDLALWDDYDQVTNKEHYKEVFWRRNPFKLYSKEIQDLLK